MKDFQFMIVILIILGINCVPMNAQTDSSTLDDGIAKLATDIGSKMELDNRMEIAIVDLTYLDGHSDDLCKYLAEELTTQLTQSKKYKVIERRMLQKVLEEQKISATDMMDAANAKNLGKLLGVKALVTGSIADRGASIRINMRLLATDTGEVFDAVATTIQKDDSILKMTGQEVSSGQMTKETPVVFFEDDFDSGLKNNWEPMFGEWRATQRGLGVINPTDGSDQRILVGDIKWKDYAIEVDVIPVINRSDFSVIFRALNNRNFYLAHFDMRGVSPAQFNWYILRDGKFSDKIAQIECTFALDQANRIRVEVRSDFFVVFLNGKEISTFQDASNSSGRVGLRLLGKEQVRFDNFKVVPLLKP